MTYCRMKPADRKDIILAAAIQEAGRLGFNNFRLVDVAERAECSTASVMRYWKTMEQLRRAVMGAAIKDKVLRIVGVGVAIGHPRCKNLPADLRRTALESLQG